MKQVRYMDDLGNFAINQMTLEEVCAEALQRMQLLDNHNHQVVKEADLRIQHILGEAYYPFQFLVFKATETQEEYATAIMIHLHNRKVVPLDFHCYYDNKENEFFSFAHRFLDNLRELCAEYHLRTDAEEQFRLEIQYHGWNE